MKILIKKIFSPLTLISVFLYVSCSGMYDNLEKYNQEIVYPDRFDTIYATLGFERVELDLFKAGRLNEWEFNMGKALVTVYEYDDKTVMIDSMSSWLNITGLTEKRLYRFKVYTMDEYGNKSVPQSISVVPYVSEDRDLLDVTSPRLLVQRERNFAVIDWPNATGLNTPLADFAELTYSYIDRDGIVRDSTLYNDDDLFILAENLPSLSVNTIDFTYKLIPILADGVTRLLDTIVFEKPLVLNTPTGSTPIFPTERNTILANAVDLTYGAAESLTKLSLPMHISSWYDLFYFPNLEELDLTGKGLKNVMPDLFLTGNSVTRRFGGGDYHPYMQRVEYTKHYPISPRIRLDQALIGALDYGLIKKITYIKNSLGIDDLLEPYVTSGQVELIYPNESWYPAEAPLDLKLLHEGRPANTAFESRITNPVNPAQVPAATTISNPNQVIMVTPVGRNATFAFTLPREYLYDLERYRYLKFSVFMTGGDQLINSTGNNTYGAYRQIWPRIRYSFWTPDISNNPFGSGDTWEWAPTSRTGWVVTPEAVNNDWTHFSMDLKPATDKFLAANHAAPYNTPAAGHHHTRNICFSLSGEQGPNPYIPVVPIVYYFADVRLSKTP